MLVQLKNPPSLVSCNAFIYNKEGCLAVVSSSKFGFKQSSGMSSTDAPKVHTDEEEDLLRQSTKKRACDASESTDEPPTKRLKQMVEILTDDEQRIKKRIDKLLYDPREYVCSISRELYVDPVFCSDGFTYERANITEWLQKNSISPQNGMKLASRDLLNNFSTKQNVKQFKDTNTSKILQFLEEFINTEEARKPRHLMMIGQLLERVKKFSPDKERTYELFVRLYEMESKTKELIEALTTLGKRYHMKSKREEATNAFTRVENLIEDKEERIDFIDEIYTYYCENHDLQGSRKMLHKLVEYFMSEESHESVVTILTCVTDEDVYDQYLLDQLLACQTKLNSDTSNTLIYLGDLATKENRFEQAVGYYSRALELKPNSPIISLKLRDSLVSAGEKKKASVMSMKLAEMTADVSTKASYMRRAVELDRDDKQLLDTVVAFFRDNQLLTEMVAILFEHVKHNDSSNNLLFSSLETISYVLSRTVEEHSTLLAEQEKTINDQSRQLWINDMARSWNDACMNYLRHIPKTCDYTKLKLSSFRCGKKGVKSLVHVQDKTFLIGTQTEGVKLFDIKNVAHDRQIPVPQDFTAIWNVGVTKDFLLCTSDERDDMVVHERVANKPGVVVKSGFKVGMGKKNLIGFGDNYVVTGCTDGKIMIDFIQAKESMSLHGVMEIQQAHNGSVRCLEYGPGGRLISGGSDKLIKVWNIASGKCEMTLAGSEYEVCTMALINERTLASSDKTQIRIWDLCRGELLGELCGHLKDVNQILSLGNVIASCSDDNRILLWDYVKFEQLHVLATFESYVFNLISIPSGEIVAVDDRGTIRLWK